MTHLIGAAGCNDRTGSVGRCRGLDDIRSLEVPTEWHHRDVDVSSLLMGAGLGIVASSIVAPFLAPWGRKAERAGETVAAEDPLDVLVDTDQAIIWAGAPPWVGFSYYFPGGLPDDDPPAVAFDWSRWAYKNGGVDVGLTMIQLTIQARQRAAVVLDSPIARVVERTTVAHGAVGTYGAGGADLHPRHFRVELDLFDPPSIEYRNEDYQSVSNPAFKLASGDVERFHIWAYATSNELVEWTLELPVIVNGKRRLVQVDGPTDTSFRTLGCEHGLTECMSYG